VFESGERLLPIILEPNFDDLLRRIPGGFGVQERPEAGQGFLFAKRRFAADRYKVNDSGISGMSSRLKRRNDMRK